jgi:hypothetical protein
MEADRSGRPGALAVSLAQDQSRCTPGIRLGLLTITQGFFSAQLPFLSASWSVL